MYMIMQKIVVTLTQMLMVLKSPLEVQRCGLLVCYCGQLDCLQFDYRQNCSDQFEGLPFLRVFSLRAPAVNPQDRHSFCTQYIYKWRSKQSQPAYCNYVSNYEYVRISNIYDLIRKPHNTRSSFLNSRSVCSDILCCDALVPDPSQLQFWV